MLILKSWKYGVAGATEVEVRFLTERDIPSLGVRTGGWVEVDVSAVVAVVVALGGGGEIRGMY